MRRMIERRWGRLMVATGVAASLGGLLAGGTLAQSRQIAPATVGGGDHTIRVSGHGESSLSPDMALISLGVENRAADAAAAFSENARKMTAVIAAIKAHAVSDNHIQTTNISIWRDEQKGEYQVSHQITVRIDSVNAVGPILDAAVAAGANSSSGVQFGLKDPSLARSRALQAAVADARKHADAIAGSLTVTIIGVTHVTEGVDTPSPVRYAAGAPAASTPVQGGEINISADVTVSYAFN